MLRTLALGFRHFARTTIAAFLLLPGLAFAQDVTEPALKAVFIYNFARFTEWPGRGPAAEPFLICVFGAADVSDALERTVKGRLLGGKGIIVLRLAAMETQRICQILYVSNVPLKQAEQFLDSVRDSQVLTISDIVGFTELGGITQFFFEHGQLRFRIRQESAKRAHLQISSKLLMLSK